MIRHLSNQILTAARSLALVGSLAAAYGPAALDLVADTGCGDWASHYGQPGVNNTVNASIVYKGDLYIAGNFTVAGGTTISRIARWDGFTWQPLGTGVNGTVEAMCEFNGDLIVGGTFTQAGGVSANRIARWNGLGWSALAGGFDGTVNSLAVHGDQLVVGGSFQNAGTTAAARVARWTGAAWEAVGVGFNASVKVVASYHGELFAAGTFSSSGDLIRKGIARWDGSAWQSVGTGIVGTPETAVLYHDMLVLGGTLSNAGGASLTNLAAWDGQNWMPVGQGLNGSVQSLLVNLEAGEEILLAGGSFSGGAVAPTLLLNRVARFDGTAWQPMGGAAMNDTVQTLAMHNGQLIAAGNFASAGIEFTNRIANFVECQPASTCSADLDSDGQVGAPDMAILLGAWGLCD
jgi:hypothetical protein